MSIFTTRGAADPKVMGIIESGSLGCFFWHLQSLIGHMVPDIMPEISKKLSNNCFNVNFHHQGEGVLTPMLWAPLNLACRDTSFGTLQSLIRHTVPEILTARKILEEWNKT